jgi:hypothetical protein
MSDISQVCGRCIHWLRFSESMKGECHRYPPIFNSDVIVEGEVINDSCFIYPITVVGNRCGEWEGLR